ncbi:MAG: hypothetical protein KGI19_06830 [Thaumarchaeota archaeon]|nr:hypothetical protein [Nitrososphaerota archaeon]
MQQDRSIGLAGLFSGIGKTISMDKFEDKLEVQKIAYIAQEYGINLGYPFEWYLRGPYCKQVSEDAHAILDTKAENVSPSTAGLDEQQVKELGNILRPFINNPEWLEIAGSLLYLRNENYARKQLDQIIGYMLEDLTYGYKNFNESLVRKVLSDMVKIGLIK